MNDVTRREFLGTGALGATGLLHTPPAIERLLAALHGGFALEIRALDRLSLTGISWVELGPTTPVAGVRLRWLSPALFPRDKKYEPLPTTYVIERAPLTDKLIPSTHWRKIDVGTTPTCHAPETWWSTVMTRRSTMPLLFTPSPGPVQVLTFVYRGASTTCRLRDSRGRTVADLQVEDGQRVYYEAAEITDAMFLSVGDSSVRLSESFSLNLRGDQEHDLAFEQIAEIDADYVLDSASTLPRERLDGFSSLTPSDWYQLNLLAREASAEVTTSPAHPNNFLSARQALAATIAARWEYAVLTGFGFYDGPRRRATTIDRIRDTVLKAPPNQALVYRVRETGSRSNKLSVANARVSNLFVLDPGTAPALRPPENVAYSPGTIVVSADPDRLDGSGLPAAIYSARTVLSWEHTADPPALGIEVSERVSKSQLSGRPGYADEIRLYANGRSVTHKIGKVRRAIEVPFADITIKGMVRSIDGWDRVSTDVPISAASFELDFRPNGPQLSSCTITEVANPKEVNLERDASATPWKPHELLKALGGELHVYARIMPPAEQVVTVAMPVRTAPDTLQATVSGIDSATLAKFTNGVFVSGDFRADIVAIAGLVVTLEAFEDVDPDLGSEVLFPPGEATLAQLDTDPALWRFVSKVTDALSALPFRLTVVDTSLTAPSRVEKAEYAWRVVYKGLDGASKAGPLGNVVTAMRYPDRPPVSPPFTVSSAGKDYAGRIGLIVTLTADASTSDSFTMSWAPGPITDYAAANAFAAVAMSGLLGSQGALEKRVLFDLIDVGRFTAGDPITVGVRNVNSSGQTGDYKLVQTSL